MAVDLRSRDRRRGVDVRANSHRIPAGGGPGHRVRPGAGAAGHDTGCHRADACRRFGLSGASGRRRGRQHVRGRGSQLRGPWPKPGLGVRQLQGLVVAKGRGPVGAGRVGTHCEAFRGVPGRLR